MGFDSEPHSGERVGGPEEECKVLLDECFRRLRAVTVKIRHDWHEIECNMGNFRVARDECDTFVNDRHQIPIAPVKLDPLLRALQTMSATLASTEATIRTEIHNLTANGVALMVLDRVDTTYDEFMDQQDNHPLMLAVDKAFDDHHAPAAGESLESLYTSIRHGAFVVVKDLERFSATIERVKEQLKLGQQVNRGLLQEALLASPHLASHQAGYLEDRIDTVQGLANGYFAVTDAPVQNLSVYYSDLVNILDTHMRPLIEALKTRKSPNGTNGRGTRTEES